jgi:hypothetical protein
MLEDEAMTATLHPELMNMPTLAPVRATADEARQWRTATIGADATVRAARDLVRETGQGVLVVTRASQAVGIITKAELWGPGVGVYALVREILNWELVAIRPDADVDHTLGRYRDAAWASLFRRRPGGRAEERSSVSTSS